MSIARYARLLVALIAGCAGVVFAQQTFTYPEKGQSPQQQAFDKGQCYTWAVQQSNFDPLNPPPPSMPPPVPNPPQYSHSVALSVILNTAGRYLPVKAGHAPAVYE